MTQDYSNPKYKPCPKIRQGELCLMNYTEPLMAMTSLFAAFIVSFGGNDRNLGLLLLLLIYLFGALSILFAVYLEKLEKNRAKVLREVNPLE